MNESINLRICECYHKSSRYVFLKYKAQLRQSQRGKWSRTFSSFDFGLPSRNWTLENIALQVVYSPHYRNMTNPSYNFLLWEGDYPKTMPLRDRGPKFTKAPPEKIKKKLEILFDEYYQTKRLVASGQYNEAWQKIKESKIGDDILANINDNLLRKFYIALRKKSKNKAKKMARKIFPPEFFFELETAFLHHLE